MEYRITHRILFRFSNRLLSREKGVVFFVGFLFIRKLHDVIWVIPKYCMTQAQVFLFAKVQNHNWWVEFRVLSNGRNGPRDFVHFR